MQPTCKGIIGAGQGLIFQPTAAEFSDSLQNTPVLIGTIPVNRTNALANLIFTVPRGATNVTIFVANNLFGATTANIGLTVFVDGAVFATPQPTVINDMDALLVVLDGQAHTVEICQSYQEYDPSTVGNILGAYIYQVAVYGSLPTLVPNPSVSDRLVIYGDSIPTGALATVPSELGWPALLRASGEAGRVSLETWGGRALWDDAGNVGGYGFPNLTDLAQRLVGLLFSATTRRIWINVGFNDYSPGFNHWNAASYETALASLFDAIHAQDPSAQVFGQSMIITGQETTANAFGDVPPDYRAAMFSAASGRSWVTPVDGLTLMSVGNLAPGGVHPTTAGHAQIHSNVVGLL